MGFQKIIIREPGLSTVFYRSFKIFIDQMLILKWLKKSSVVTWAFCQDFRRFLDSKLLMPKEYVKRMAIKHFSMKYRYFSGVWDYCHIDINFVYMRKYAMTSWWIYLPFLYKPWHWYLYVDTHHTMTNWFSWFQNIH